jgi:uncharacterized BrkB/YihY/UPF0761 family membrane protein
MLAQPVADLMFVRGSEYNNDWLRAILVTLIMLAPATYALFFGTAGELLKTRVTTEVHQRTMRFAAVAMLPYIALVTLATLWESGPQESLMVLAGLTIPIGMAATVWASTRNH